MERGGLHGNHCPPKSSSGLEINESSNNNSNTGKTRNRNAAAAAMGVREQDKYMPIANVIRIMRRVLPANAKISDEAKETIQECVSEYIGFITSEANERCRREQRKTVTAEDLLKAMKTLGFEEYIEPLSLYLDRYREMESDRGFPLLKRTASTMETVGVADLGSGLSMVHDPGVFGYLRAGSSTNSSGPTFGPYAPYK